MITIENLELDEDNIEFNYAYDFVKHTDKLVYLTGKAGTGKTTFLKSLKDNTSKKAVILAPTGVAAINAGGQTIHSFFHLPFGPFVPNDKRLRLNKEFDDLDSTTIYNTFKYNDDKKTIIEKLELLIIDEISMVRCDTLDVIDRILRVFRKKRFLPFGGVQVILIGDTFQLPPIADFEQWQILKNYYDSPFFFSSKVVVENRPVYIELKKIYRQKEQEFIELLNKIRVNQINEFELNELNKKYNPTFSSNGIDNHIILSTTNAQVNQTNATKLHELETEAKFFEGEVIGIFPKDSKGNFVLPTEQNLHLKIDAQVMILKNDSGDLKRYFNGKIGKISSLEENRIIVEFADQSKVQIEKKSWNNIQYIWNKEKRIIEEKIIGTFTQYPLRLAWAITVHKSQGLTFDRVYADLGSAFEDGQVYVALSRCTSFSGLVLKSQIPRNKIKTNSKVLEFAKTETPNTLIVEELNSGKADYFYRKIREDIKISNFHEVYNNFIKALRFRNDIETDIFRKYFITTANKFVSYKSKQERFCIDLKDIKSKNKEIKSKLFINENENIELKNKIEEQNRGLKILLDKINDYEIIIKNELEKSKYLNSDIVQLKIEVDSSKTENLTFKEKIRHLENKKNELKRIKETKILEIKSLSIDNVKLESKVLHFENEIVELKTKLNILEDNNRIMKNEIERQKKIKWYHKLMGNE
ncbi:MAG: AAA family ATPase [Flavobacterium sp.]|uniref:ATP-dependent DNA helicase n=1 Tax=Flavobacterium sp. TaxID=239 RepID=UPI001B0A0931|nr:AAA family ATPase [Flavobacterium sp.]MBO9586430.1 AAA family ATPase [Flavobacterium sp.]